MIIGRILFGFLGIAMLAIMPAFFLISWELFKSSTWVEKCAIGSVAIVVGLGGTITGIYIVLLAVKWW